MMDIVVGTVDRDYLDGEALMPERHLWWDSGVGWIRDFAVRGSDSLPIHPTHKVDESIH